MDLSEAQRVVVAALRPGDIILVLKKGDDGDVLATLVLPVHLEGQRLMCCRLPDAFITEDDPDTYFVGELNSEADTGVWCREAIVRYLCHTTGGYRRAPDNDSDIPSHASDDAEEEWTLVGHGVFGDLQPFDTLVRGKDTLLLRPTAAEVRKYIYGGRCAWPECHDRWISNVAVIWQRQGVEDRLWHGFEEYVADRPCLFCFGLDIAAEWDEYHKSVIRDGLGDTAWSGGLYARLNERQRELGHEETAEDEVPGGEVPEDNPDFPDVIFVVQEDGELTAIFLNDDDDTTNAATDEARDDVIRMKYQQLDRQHSTPVIGPQSSCLVCTENYGLQNVVSWLPCEHLHHSGCLDSWLQEQATCPLCRYYVKEKPGGDDSLAVDNLAAAQCRICRSVSRGHMLRCERKRCYLGRLCGREPESGWEVVLSVLLESAPVDRTNVV